MERAIIKGNPIQMANHPWVYSGNVLSCSAPKGSCVEVYTRKGVFLGSAIYNPDSNIALRFYSREREELNYLLIKEKIMLADKKRKKYFSKPYYRVVFSESDGLPGLIVDRYGEGFVFQINSYGMEIRREDIVKAIFDAFSPVFIVEKSEGHARKVEGLKERTEVALNNSSYNLSRIIVEEDGLKFYVDLINGQKTGFFYDQRRNRSIIEDHLRGSYVLDLFSYTGAFSLRALRKGKKVFAIDISEESIALLKENVKLNGLPEENLICEVKDAFEFHKEIASLRMKFDFVIVDPPSVVRRASDLDYALKSYVALLNGVFNMLEKGGMVAVFSCSNHIKWEHLYSVLQRSTGVARRSFRMVKFLNQDFRDHVVPVNFPEAEYLRGFLLEEDV